MSFRSMSKVSFLMLLAMALAAASAHARLDLLGQLPTSNNQPAADPNYRGGKIPYLTCRRICSNCVCDRRAPEYAECYCQDWERAAPLDKFEEVQMQLEGNSDVNIESQRRMSKPECMSKCDRCVACTRMYPPESNTCICVMNNSSSKEPASIV